MQINSILQAPPASAEDAETRFRYIKSLIGGDETRARKLAAVTQGMSREEVHELVGVTPRPAAAGETSEEMVQALALLARRKREIIERECFGLIEFVEPAHDFSVVGGMDEVKRELGGIARNIRDGRTSRVPMGLLFTGPMGTGKTFVAEAFGRERADHDQAEELPLQVGRRDRVQPREDPRRGAGHRQGDGHHRRGRPRVRHRRRGRRATAAPARA